MPPKKTAPPSTWLRTRHGLWPSAWGPPQTWPTASTSCTRWGMKNKGGVLGLCALAEMLCVGIMCYVLEITCVCYDFVCRIVCGGCTCLFARLNVSVSSGSTYSQGSTGYISFSKPAFFEHLFPPSPTHNFTYLLATLSPLTLSSEQLVVQVPRWQCIGPAARGGAWNFHGCAVVWWQRAVRRRRRDAGRPGAGAWGDEVMCCVMWCDVCDVFDVCCVCDVRGVCNVEMSGEV